VGKSTVSTNLAVSLALDGAKVGVLDADIYGPNIPTLMGVGELPPPNGESLVPALAHGVRLMSMGFLIETGYDVETEYYNFDSLNIPFDHPAREMQDTFWLTNGMLMRTHTSANQVRSLEKYGAPQLNDYADICHAGGKLSIPHMCGLLKGMLPLLRETRIDGIEVAEMVRRGIELIVGARRDPSFGPVVMFGHGGIYVEVMKDVSFRAAGLARAEAVEMMKEIRAYPLLLGVRGEERKDIDTVVDAILRLATVIRRCPGISDIEVNPLVVYDEGEGAVAVDARVLLAKIEGGRSDA
jgi:hypothetical protein